MYEKVLTIQKELKVPKDQVNKFGGYKYRSAEDIIEAVKPLCHQQGLILKLTDEVVSVGDRNYVKAVAELSDGTNTVVASGWAREDETRKGMSGDQLTGAASSYARKYALNGLLAIDDTKDSDATENGSEGQNKPLSASQTLTEREIKSNIPF